MNVCEQVRRTRFEDTTKHFLNVRMPAKGLLTLFLLWTTFAFAGDTSGKWTGTLEFKGEDGQTQAAAVHADLKQTSGAITGTLWKEEGQHFEIEQGQVKGNEISFKFRAPEGEEEQMVVHSVTATLIGPKLEGTLEFELGSQKATAKLTLTREK